MKEMFQNQKGFNTVLININCKAGNIDLKYQLLDHPVQHLWQEIYSRTQKFKMGIPVNYPTDKVLVLFNELCNHLGVDNLPDDFDQDDLNRFHSMMVKNTRSDNSGSLELLNKLIHVLETKLKNKYVEYCSNVVFYSCDNEQYIPIKEEYKLWLEPNSKWGDLILGYGTLGKDWLDIYYDKDDCSELAIQKTISSETCLNFRTEFNFPKANEILFYRWAKQTEYAVPLDNLNELSLGRYCLGKLIIDSKMLDFHNNVGDWYIPNHICKLAWNKDVIGSEVEILSMKFFNDNLYQEMSIDHAQIRSIL